MQNSPVHTIAAQVLSLIARQGMSVGRHLPSQSLADQLRLSRTPINHALEQLAKQGYLRREVNRGYFVAKPIEVKSTNPNPLNTAYFALADDLLSERIPLTNSETSLKIRYQLSQAELNALLIRIANEGWIEKKLGYGWEFSSMLTTPDSLLQSYRLRLALEPAALLEPGYKLDAQVIEECRRAEHHLLNGGIASDTPDQLHERGVRFHEALVQGSGNPFFIDSLRRVNRVRRLLSYRSMQDRTRYQEHCAQHLALLDLLEAGKNQKAAKLLREHLSHTLENLQKIRSLLAIKART